MRRRLRAVAAACLVGAATMLVGPVPAHAAPAEQWHLTALRVAEAHRTSTGAGVIVAVIDSGVRPHPDLDGQVLAGTDLSGQDLAEDDGHGTVVAGIIAGNGPAPGKVRGIAPGAKILPVRVASGGFGANRRYGEAVRWATDNGAKVINMSFGAEGGVSVEDMIAAVRYAQERDVVVVASSGNKGNDTVRDGIPAPARLPGVIAVGATGRTGELWDGTVTGPAMAITAPGVDIPATYPTDPGARARYVTLPGGTSSAAPMVAGAAALVRSKFPQLGARDVIQRLVSTADDAGPAGRDEQYGFGRLNLVKALTADVAPVSANPLGEPQPSTGGPTAPPVAQSERDYTRVLVFGAVGVGGFVLLVIGLVVVLILVNRRARVQRR